CFRPALPCQATPRKRTPWKHPNPLLETEWDHFPLLFSINEVVMVLHGHETRPPIRAGSVKHLSELPRGHRGSTEVKHLPRAHQMVQRLECFLDWRLRIKTMDLIKIHVISSEPSQTVINRVHDMFARKSALIPILTHRIKYF